MPAALAAAAVIVLLSVPGFASVKALLLIGYFAYAFASVRVTRGGLVLGGSIVASLLAGLAIGQFEGVPLAVGLDQFSRIAIFFAIFLCAHRIRSAFDSAEHLDRVCRGAAVVAALAKVIIVVAVVAFGFSLDDIQAWLGFETVTLDIGFNIQRLQFPTDIVILFLVACYVGRRSKLANAVFLVSVMIVVMLSFSRFIFVCFFASVFVRAIWLRRFDFLPRFALAMVLVVTVIFADSLIDRFVGEGSGDSDDTRVEQIGFLSRQIAIAPLFGHGLGASVPHYARSESMAYSYEVQWYALTMQLGAVGVAWFLGNLMALLFKQARELRAFLCVAALFGLWALSGFTNPFLTSLGSAVGFSIAIWRMRLPAAETAWPLAAPKRRRRRAPRGPMLSQKTT